MKEKIINIIKQFNDDEIAGIWNEYCYATNNGEEIYDYDTLEDLMNNSNEGITYWLNRFYYGSDYNSENGSACPNRNYYVFNAYGNIISFDYIYNKYSEEFNNIDIDYLVDYIVENKEAFGNIDIEETLNS